MRAISTSQSLDDKTSERDARSERQEAGQAAVPRQFNASMDRQKPVLQILLIETPYSSWRAGSCWGY